MGKFGPPRTVLTKLQAKKGGFKDCLPEDLLTAVLAEVIKRGKVDPSKIEYVSPRRASR